MSLVAGTNCGFVTTAPTNDPDGQNNVLMDNYVRAIKDTSPSNAVKITEIGWWCDTDSEEVNFEVGIYTHDSVNNEPEDVVGSIDTTNAKGTTSGWKKCTGLNISISPNTIYWIGIQLDNPYTSTYTNNGGASLDYIFKTDETALPDPTWDIGGTINSTGISIYAVYENGSSLSNISSIQGVQSITI